MRWVLPGGAVLDDGGRGDGETVVACRPGAAVTSDTRRRAATVTAVAGPPGDRPETAVGSPSGPRTLADRLTTTKLLLEILAVLVGLIGGVLALIGVSRK